MLESDKCKLYCMGIYNISDWNLAFLGRHVKPSFFSQFEKSDRLNPNVTPVSTLWTKCLECHSCEDDYGDRSGESRSLHVWIANSGFNKDKIVRVEALMHSWYHEDSDRPCFRKSSSSSSYGLTTDDVIVKAIDILAEHTDDNSHDVAVCILKYLCAIDRTLRLYKNGDCWFLMRQDEGLPRGSEKIFHSKEVARQVQRAYQFIDYYCQPRSASGPWPVRLIGHEEFYDGFDFKEMLSSRVDKIVQDASSFCNVMGWSKTMARQMIEAKLVDGLNNLDVNNDILCEECRRSKMILKQWGDDMCRVDIPVGSLVFFDMDNECRGYVTPELLVFENTWPKPIARILEDGSLQSLTDSSICVKHKLTARSWKRHLGLFNDDDGNILLYNKVGNGLYLGRAQVVTACNQSLIGILTRYQPQKTVDLRWMGLYALGIDKLLNRPTELAKGRIVHECVQQFVVAKDSCDAGSHG